MQFYTILKDPEDNYKITFPGRIDFNIGEIVLMEDGTSLEILDKTDELIVKDGSMFLIYYFE